MDTQQIFYLAIILLAVWDLAWKAMALWKAARNGQRNWFMALMIINSIGILPIIYIKFFQKKTA